MTDIVKALGATDVCSTCGSGEGMHFGDCPLHPTKLAMLGVKPTEPIPPTAFTGGFGKQENHVNKVKNHWLAGNEIKVTEQFLKEAIEEKTGGKVGSIVFKGKSLIVRFE